MGGETGFTTWLKSINHNLTLSGAARAAGLSRRTLIGMATGQYLMPVNGTLSALAKYAGCGVRTVRRQLLKSAAGAAKLDGCRTRHGQWAHCVGCPGLMAIQQQRGTK